MNLPPAAFAYLFAMSLMAGSSYALIRMMVETIPPATGAMARTVLGAVLLLTFASVMRIRLPRDRGTLGKLFFIGLTGGAMTFTLLAFATQYIPSSAVAILFGASPMLTMVLAHVLTEDDRLSASKILGLTVAFLGIVVLFGPDALAGVTESLLGMAYAFGAAAASASTYIVARRVRGVSAVASAGTAFVWASLVLIPTAFVVESPIAVAQSGTVSLQSVLGLIGCTIFASVAANVTFYKLVGAGGPTFAALHAYIAPLIGLFWGVLLFDEPAGLRVLLALALVLGGIVIANFRSLRALVGKGWSPPPA